MSDMSAELVHDLRMPLQLIYSCAQMLQLELGDSGQPAGRYVALLMDGVGQLQRMLNGALAECDRERRRGDALRLTEVDMPSCVRELCQRCRPYADQLGVRLSCSGNVAALRMVLDEDKLSRILLNLISNALRFTPRGGRIAVSWRALGDFAEIAVKDTGAGIAPERLPYLFLEGETEGGHGYGLAIVRDYARAMGGEVTARSVPGKGSAFTVRLPVGGAAMNAG